MRRCSVAKRRALALLLCLLLLLCTACGGQAQEDAGALHCTVRIECSTVLAHMDDLKAGKADIVPSDGVLLPETTVAFSEGDTVFDVLQQVCRAQGIHMESTWTPAYNSAYIEGIGNLYEFDCGELSGWMYSVNGVWPDYGCSGYTLHDGDTVVWSYTCDLGRAASAPCKENHERFLLGAAPGADLLLFCGRAAADDARAAPGVSGAEPAGRAGLLRGAARLAQPGADARLARAVSGTDGRRSTRC